MATKPTGAQAKALEAKALKADTKSAGMVSLFERGYSVTEVKDIFEAPYGFAYGVAVRNGFVEPTPREANGTTTTKARKAPTTNAGNAKAAATAKTSSGGGGANVKPTGKAAKKGKK